MRPDTQSRPACILERSRLATCLGLAISASAAGVGATDLAQAREPIPNMPAHILKWHYDAANHQPLLRAHVSTATTATRHVTNCYDSGSGSLRATIASANNADTIDLSDLSCDSIFLATPIIIAQDDLSLIGAGADNTYIMPYSNESGLLKHTGTGELYLQALTLALGDNIAPTSGNPPASAKGGCVSSNGHVELVQGAAKFCTAQSTAGDALGGAIYALDGVTLVDSIISGNHAIASSGDAMGGGIYTLGFLTMMDSTAAFNSAESASGFARAGALWAYAGGWIDRSTVSDNESSGSGGGLVIFSDSFSIWLNTATISGNQAAINAGARIGGVDNMTVENCTITNNVMISDSASLTYTNAGLFMGDPSNSAELISNIIAGNTWTNGSLTLPSDLATYDGFQITGHHNLIGAIDTRTGPLPFDTIHAEDAHLGPLRDNGGPTETHAIKAGSWAFNLGDQVPGLFNPSEDQRGMSRDVGAGIDIGSFESDALFIGRFEDPPMFYIIGDPPGG